MTEKVRTNLQRDAKGRLLKGHPFMAGLPNGRKRKPRAEVKEALKLAEGAMPEIILLMISRAKGIPDGNGKGNFNWIPHAVRQQAAEYLMDRVYGRPNPSVSSQNGEPLVIVVRDESMRTVVEKIMVCERKMLPGAKT